MKPFFLEDFFTGDGVLLLIGFSSREANMVFSTLGTLAIAFLRSSCLGNLRDPGPLTGVYDAGHLISSRHIHCNFNLLVFGKPAYMTQLSRVVEQNYNKMGD